MNFAMYSIPTCWMFEQHILLLPTAILLGKYNVYFNLASSCCSFTSKCFQPSSRKINCCRPRTGFGTPTFTTIIARVNSYLPGEIQWETMRSIRWSSSRDIISAMFSRQLLRLGGLRSHRRQSEWCQRGQDPGLQEKILLQPSQWWGLISKFSY